MAWAASTRWPTSTIGPLIDAGALVAPQELQEPVLIQLARVGLDADPLRGHAGDDAGAGGDHDLAGVARGALLHARADDRRLGLEERDGLTLHVRAHEGAVRVVVLEERDQGGRDGDDLLRAHVHVLDLVRPGLRELVAETRRDPLVEEVALVIEARVGLGDDVLLLLVGGEVLDLVGHDRADRERVGLLALELGRGWGVECLATLEDDGSALGGDVGPGREGQEGRVVPAHGSLHPTVGRLDEAVAVDPPVRRERADQPDVRAFRRLDRADATVVAVMDVADVEAGPLAGQAARSEGRQAPLRRELGERVGLVHELAELAAAEELLHRGHDGPDVDQGVRGGLVDLLDRHPLANDALHAQEADAEGVLDQLAVGPDPAVPEVVDVVLGMEPAIALDEVPDDRRDVLAGDRPLALDRELEAHPLGDAEELLAELVAADPAEIVAAEVEEQSLDELAGVVTRRRVARAQLLVDLDERLGGRPGHVLVQGVGDERVLGIDVHGAEERRDLVVGLVADGAQQGGRRDLALAIHLDPELVLVVRLELEPGTAVRDDLGAEQHPARGGILELAVVDAGRADQLADDDALGAVDDERAEVGHPRVVTHVDTLALDLAGLLDQELDVHVQRPAEGQVLGPALLLGVLRVTELVVEELELHDLAGEVLDRADLVEELPEALFDEPLERLQLELDEVGDGKDLGDPGVALAHRGEVRGCRRFSSRQHERPLLDGGRGEGKGPGSQNG